MHAAQSGLRPRVEVRVHAERPRPGGQRSRRRRIWLRRVTAARYRDGGP